MRKTSMAAWPLRWFGSFPYFPLSLSFPSPLCLSLRSNIIIPACRCGSPSPRWLILSDSVASSAAMDESKAGLFSDLKGNDKENATMICFSATMSTSSGVWLKEQPLDYSFPLLLAQFFIIFLASSLAHSLLRPIGFPQVISHTIAGIVLGPSCLSRNRGFQETIFPLRSWVNLDLISQFAFVLFIFVIGVKTDLTLIRRSGRNALAVAMIGTVVPYLAIMSAGIFHPRILGDVGFGKIVANIANRWSVTSNTVVSCLLTEFNLLTSKLGRLAMSASLIAEFQVVLLTAAFNSFFYGSSLLYILGSLFSFSGFIASIWLMARCLTVWIVRRTPDGNPIDEFSFLTLVLVALGSSVIGELVGETPMAGPLLFGLLLPGGPPIGTALVDRLDKLVSGILLPVFCAVAGLRTNVHDFARDRGGEQWGRATCLIGSGVSGKFAGVIIAGLYSKMPIRDAFVLALILNCHGVVEIFSFNSWEDFGQADSEMYAVNVLALIIVGGTTASLLKALYGPSARFTAKKQRTVQSIGQIGELRLLACVHGEDHVPPLLALTDVIHPSVVSPLCIYLLHLSPLAGQSHATLLPYKRKKRRRASFKSLSAGSTSDRVVNSFRELERHYPPGRLAMLPFIGVSPYATMHDDICALGQEKMVDLILLPFHRRIDSGLCLPDSVKPAVRAVNNNVLLYANCSAAILVDRGLSCGPVYSLGTAHRVAAVFIGGDDDREALAIASRMVENPSTELVLFRFLNQKGEPADGGGKERDEEGMLDDEAVEQFLVRHEGNDRVDYREKEVGEGSETVAAIRENSEDCSLILVGRGEGRVSPATSGLEMWSDFPELGVVGDVLASPDFGGKASVLVVHVPAKGSVAKAAAIQVGSDGAATHVRSGQHARGDEAEERLIN